MSMCVWLFVSSCVYILYTQVAQLTVVLACIATGIMFVVRYNSLLGVLVFGNVAKCNG